VRDNKRRFRSRQKEYVADLERSVREYQRKGVQATKEVQIAAQRVARENVLLRQLLRYQGIDNNVVDSWIQKDDDRVNETGSTDCANSQQERHTQLELHQSVRVSVLLKSCSSTHHEIQDEREEVSTNDKIGGKLPEYQPFTPKEEEMAGQYLPSPNCLSSRKCRQTSPVIANISSPSFLTQPVIASIAEVSSVPRPAPCKLMTQLAANPSADITQVPIELDQIDKPGQADGVECSRAYEMLMQFATTEENLDAIALALENGCVANRGPGGGCKMKNTYIMKALDDIQD
jgi:hypothetical protein